MKSQFVRLFLVIFFSLLIIGLLTDLFTKQSTITSHSINLDSLQSSVKVNQDNQVVVNKGKILPLAKLAWPDELKNKLLTGEVVSLSDADEHVFYYWLADNKLDVIEIGPFELDNNEHNQYVILTIVFYSLFALILFVWLTPIFKDITRLIDITNKFSKDRDKITSDVNKSSVLYPLAKSVELMSKQIVRFLSLQRFLASSVSHDIRTPLSRIGFLLAMTTKDNLDEYKIKIENEIDEIDLLTDEFINLARLEESHTKLNIINQDVSCWLDETLEKVSETTPITINLAFSNKQWVFHDAKFLQRAVQNMLVNAVKYAEESVNLTVTISDGNACFCVEDDGTGIEPEEQERLTGLYERGKSSKNIGSGYGIGLAFVNVIAEWHGGEVKISQSKSLGGASVSIIIPTNTSS